MRPAVYRVLSAALLLAASGLVASLALTSIERLTAGRIAEAERQAELRALAMVLPSTRFDNDPLADSIQVRAPYWLGSPDALPIRRARLAGVSSVLVIDSVAPDGYSGDIHLLIGIDHSGRIVGVRVTRHRETPGLGDRIEAHRSDWIDRFAGLALDDPPSPSWRVRKDGGQFDQFAGATITPRAVVRAVHRTLSFVDRHRDALENAETGSELHFDDAPEHYQPTR